MEKPRRNGFSEASLGPIQPLRIFLALGVGTWLLLSLFRSLPKLLPEGWRLDSGANFRLFRLRFETWQRSWPSLGAFYMAAGLAHFTAQTSFEAIYPPQGTWGFWSLPGSATFHVAWTGLAELAGGFGLCVGATLLGLAGALGQEAPTWLKRVPALSALGLFGLTWAVTPANVYMYTHGAQMTGLTPGDQAIPVEFHLVRGILQVLLLSLLWGYWRALTWNPN